MHARVSFYEGGTEFDFDKGVRAFEEALSSVQEMEGEQGATLLVDRKSGKAITITYWDTEEHLESSVEAADRVRQQAADTGGLVIRAVEHYEVAVEQGR
jgi:heme-degrading monooxygenase HmoA